MPESIPILWWNRTVVALRDGGPVRTLLPEDGDRVLAFCAFVHGLAPPPKRVRLFYHSQELDHLTTTCPRGSRQTIQKTLHPRFSALADPTTRWAAHRVRTNAVGTTTLLYVEQEPRLARIRAALDERGIILEAAFPVLVLLEAAPPASRLDQPVIALLHTDEAAAVYWRTAEGDRHAAFFDGSTARERAIRELLTGFSVFKTPPSFAAVNAGSTAIDLNALPQSPRKSFSAEELLSHGQALGVREVCNFLPPPTLFTADHLCRAAAAILFVASLTAAGTYAAALRAARTSLSFQQAEERRLEAGNARLKENRARIAAVSAIMDKIVVARPVKRRFLEALNRARPMQVSIRVVVLNESTWNVAGTVHGGASGEKGPYQAFLSRFAKNEGWTIGQAGKTAILQDSDFTLNGTIP